MISEGETVLAAVSGGADSVCMLHILLELSQTLNFSVCTAHFNHMLRGDESDRDEVFVQKLCADLNVPFFAERGDVAAFANCCKKSTEEAARIMRYEFLQKTAEKIGAAKIATAHNADDNAETVILNLTRGTGLSGLRGIPPVRDNIIRPILCLTRENVESYLNAKCIDYVTDSTNLEDVYSRNKLRHRVLPILRELNPRFSENLMRSSEIIRQDEEYLSAEADKIISENARENRISASLLLALPASLSSRIVRKMAKTELSALHTEDVLALCKNQAPSASLDLPGIVIMREYGDLVFGRPETASFEEITLTLESSVFIPELSLEISLEKAIYDGNIYKSFTDYLFKTTDVYGKITIRPRKPGDKLKLRGTGCTKTLKKLFTEKRIPAIYRELQPVISDEKGVLGVYMLGCDERGKPDIGDYIYRIKFKEMPHK